VNENRMICIDRCSQVSCKNNKYTTYVKVYNGQLFRIFSDNAYITMMILACGKKVVVRYGEIKAKVTIMHI
jgi:hypothetical protein